MKPITFNSSLSQKDVYLTMKELTKTNSDERLFVGKVWDDGFSVMKYRLFSRNKLFSRNVLDPKFDAVVTETDNGTKITIKVSLSKWNKIGFFILGALILGVIIFLIINAIATYSLEPIALAIVLLLWVALINLVFGLIFTLRAKRIMKTLKTILT